MADVERVTVAGHGGVRLACLRSGPPGGEPVVLLHGFPEGAALGWRHQLPALSAAGLRVWAPDQRGYGESDRPPRVRDYVIDALSADALAVLDAAAREAGRDRAHLVAHDWGGAVAWWTALAAPGRLASLTVLNCPQLAVLRRALLFGDLRQMARSWYIAWFQLPWLAPAVLGAAHAALLARGLRDSSRPAAAGRRAAFGPDDLAAYRDAAARPGALRAMIAWYRALPLDRPRPPGSDGRVRVPTRLVWGARDRALGRELAHASLATCEHGELLLIEEATHWVQHEEPERVNAAIVDWVRRSGRGA